MPKKFTRKRGGKYVGEGTYGCTYKPAMICKGEAGREPNSISKLISKKNTAGNLKGTHLLASIDPAQKFFLYPHSVCEPNITKIDPAENNLMSCGKYRKKKFSENLSGTDLIFMKNGGLDLIQYKPNATDFLHFFEDFSELFEGLQKLHENKIIHFDIKPPNIVVKKKPSGAFQFRFIDFGFMTSVADFDNTNKNLYLANYPYWPYEVRFLSPMFTKANLTEENVREFITTTLDYTSKFFTSLHMDSIGVLAADFSGSFDTYKYPMPTAAQMLKKREKLLMAIDTYSMGITLAEIYSNLTQHTYYKGAVSYPTAGLSFEALAWNEEVSDRISKPLFALVESMTKSYWLDRITPEAAQFTYDVNILPEMETFFTPMKVAVGLGLPFAPPAPGGGKRKTRKSYRK